MYRKKKKKKKEKKKAKLIALPFVFLLKVHIVFLLHYNLQHQNSLTLQIFSTLQVKRLSQK